MAEDWSIYADWNPWHGCTKVSPGCRYCYVYRQDEMYGSEVASSLCRKTAAFNLPVKRKRDKSWKIPPNKVVFTCFTSDFLLQDADPWRPECWAMMRQRSDLWFYFFTKRIDRFAQCIPPDWGCGYPNVLVGCTVENQAMADYRLPVFLAAPIRHKSIIVSPLIGPVDLSPYLNDSIEEVSVGGESGVEARPCNYDWILSIRQQCITRNIPFRFHQTGARLVKDGRLYRIPRRLQLSQAHKADIDFRIGRYFVPETSCYQWQETDYHNHQSSQPMTLETQRLILRPWLESDAPALFKYASDPLVGPQAGWPPHKSVEESLEIIRTVFSGEGMWAAELKETHEPIGCMGYLPASCSNLAIADNECEVGYWIARPYWSQGLCTEAMQAVVDHCFNSKGFATLWGDYFPENPASGRVMQKCGFADTGRETLCPNLEVGSDRPVRIMCLQRSGNK